MQNLIQGKLAVVFLFCALCAPAAEVDISKLPPAAKGPVDFDRDVRPIFEQSCFRCHGPEKPKSHFSLATRESALKGGDDNTDDIVPGDSARSRLTYNVSGLVADMQMPPPGKAEPLTPAQIGVLRAWIDEGAKWSASNAYPQLAFSVSPTTRWVGGQGDKSKFREIEGFKEGWGGGLEQFSMEQQRGPGEKISVEGHALFPDDDLQVKLTWTKADVGFVRAGVEQWRRYFDAAGGYYRPFSPPSFDLGQDLHLDIGRAWIDFGLTLPHLPQAVLGYEYQYKDGAESMLEWGNVNGKNIYPAAKDIDERTHIVKLDLTHELSGWHLEDRARVEFYIDKTLDQQITGYTFGSGPDGFVHTREDYRHVQGANTFRFEKQIRDWWLASGGYLYSRFNGDSSLNQTTVNSLDVPIAGNFWRDQVTLKRELHAFSLASLFLPVDSLSLSVGAQTEFSRQEGFGNIDLDTGDPNVPGLFFLEPAVVQSDLDETKTGENASLRYTKIPFTVLFAEGRFEQDSIGQFDQEVGNTPDVFLRDTDYFNHLLDYRTGFSTSPWRWMELNAHFRRSDSVSDYNYLRNESQFGGVGYPAFIRHREIASDEAQAKLVLHPVFWLKTTLTYQWTTSDFFTATDPVTLPLFGDVSPGGPLLAGRYRAQVYGLSTTFIPSPRLYFSSAFTYTDTCTVTAQNGVPAVAPYQGAIYSVIASANYSLNERTKWQASYSFSQAGYGQNNQAGLPLGLDYTQHGLTVGVTRKLTKCVSTNLRYSFYDYAEPSFVGTGNFTAHGIFATVIVRWP